MTTWDKRYQFSAPPAENGDVINCNMMQKYPNTTVLDGVDVTVGENANIINCVGGVTGPQLSYCANHEDNEWMELDPEPEDCPHVDETILVNGIPIYTYHVNVEV